MEIVRATEQSWDTDAFGAKAGALILEANSSKELEFELYAAMRDARERGFAFISCRLPVADLRSVHLLEDEGFRFIEMTVNPWITASRFSFQSRDLEMFAEVASEPETQTILEAIPGLFQHGRLHVDPRIPAEVGDTRYQSWIVSSTKNESARLLIIKGQDREIRAFFLFNSDSRTKSVKWLLNGMMPKFKGVGAAKEAWTAAIAHHLGSGVSEIQTTISLSNAPALNLYAMLEFSFREPAATLHWLPS